MYDMLNFHQWLSSPIAVPDVRRERLTLLANTDRERIVEVTGQTTWFVWSSEEETPKRG